jgi:hypothetical protein
MNLSIARPTTITLRQIKRGCLLAAPAVLALAVLGVASFPRLFGSRADAIVRPSQAVGSGYFHTAEPWRKVYFLVASDAQAEAVLRHQDEALTVRLENAHEAGYAYQVLKAGDKEDFDWAQELILEEDSYRSSLVLPPVTVVDLR